MNLIECDTSVQQDDPPRPVAMRVNPEGIPEALRELPCWLLWKYVLVTNKAGGKRRWAKQPFQVNRRHAKSNDPATWASFADVLAAYLEGGWDGVGMCLPLEGGFTGGDLDHVIDDEGNIAPEAMAIIERVGTYAERSPSGHGLRFIITGDVELPANKWKLPTGEIEVYQKGSPRYLTFTGDLLPDTPVEPMARGEVLAEIVAELEAVKKSKTHHEFLNGGSNGTAHHNGDNTENYRRALAAMLKVTVPGVENDGSRRLMGYARQAVRYRLDDVDAVRAVRECERISGPLPADYSDADIIERLRDATKRVTPGEAYAQQQSGGNDHEPEVEESPDPEIVPIDTFILPELPTTVLPTWASDHARALSIAKETPVAMAALLTLAAIASCVQRVFKVKIEASYHEALCIYACPAMESGERKTAIYQPTLRPLFEYQRTLRAQMEATIAAATITRELGESEIKALRKQYFREKDATERTRMQKEIEEKTLALPPIPPMPQLVSEDSTEAALGVTLANNQESQLLGSDEGGLFDNLASPRFSPTAEMDLFLKAHTGSPHTVNRIIRGSLHLNNPRLSIAISPQPHVLKALGDKDGFLNRGGLARFLLALPESTVGRRRLLPASIPDDVRRDYTQHLTALAMMGREYAEEDPKDITLEREAYDTWKAFEREIEPRMAKGADLYPVKSWASKLSGAVARIAAVCHAGDYGADAYLYPLPLDRMQAAIDFGRALIPHSLAVHRLMGGGGYSVARAVAEHYDACGWFTDTRTLTDWWRPVRTIVGETSTLFEPIARTLVDHGYLIPVEAPQRRGKRGQHFRANTHLVRKSVNPL